jgi:hypothetical protein
MECQTTHFYRQNCVTMVKKAIFAANGRWKRIVLHGVPPKHSENLFEHRL